MIGERISEILCEAEGAIVDFELNIGEKPCYTIDGFRAATKIFMSVVMDKMWELQANENVSLEYRIKMVEKCGSDIRNFVKIYTDIDTHTLYKI